MATAKTTAAATEKPAPFSETVKIKLFKDGGKYKDDVFVCINGRSCQVQRGVEVEVPVEVAYVLEQSSNQDNATANLIDQLSRDFANETRARGL